MSRTKKTGVAAGLAGIALMAGLFAGFRGRTVEARGFGVLTNGFAVVELFTSEGCSSCPPADALVAEVQREDKDLPVYILAYHVDYWDRLGWKDAFSNAAWSDRQKDYARWLNLSSIYTPQVIVNGQKEFVGSDAGALRSAISSGLQKAGGARLKIGRLVQAGGHLDWTAHVDGGGKGLRLFVAVVEHDAVTQVKAGENGGKTLSHVQIVRALGDGKPDGKGDAGGRLQWPAGLGGSQAEVIAFLQDEQSGKIEGAERAAVEN